MVCNCTLFSKWFETNTFKEKIISVKASITVILICNSKSCFLHNLRLMHLYKVLAYVLGHTPYKDVILLHQQLKEGRDGAVKKQSFCMLSKLSWYKFKLKCYNLGCKLNVMPMVTTKKIAIEYT